MYSNKIVTVINSNFKKDVFLSSHPYTSSFSFMSGQLQMTSLAFISLLTNKMFETIETLTVNISNLILETLSSVQFSCSVVSDSLRPHELQHARPPCPSPVPGVYSNSCPSSQWCHPAISSSLIPFSSCPQSLRASGSFPLSQLFAWGGQSIGVSASASVLPMNTQDWMPQYKKKKAKGNLWK